MAPALQVLRAAYVCDDVLEQFDHPQKAVFFFLRDLQVGDNRAKQFRLLQGDVQTIVFIDRTRIQVRADAIGSSFSGGNDLSRHRSLANEEVESGGLPGLFQYRWVRSTTMRFSIVPCGANSSLVPFSIA